MRVIGKDLRTMIESLVIEAMGDEPVDGDCKFVKGQVMRLYRPIKVYQKGDGTWFGGEERGRGQGNLIPKGTPCKVLERIGGRAAWVQFQGIPGPVRVDVNKFCQTYADAYASRNASRRATPKGPPAIDPTELDWDDKPRATDPHAELAAATDEMEKLKAAYIRARKRLEAAQRAVDELEKPEPTADIPLDWEVDQE